MMETNSGTGALARGLAEGFHFGSLTVSDTTVIHSFNRDPQHTHPREVVVRDATMPSHLTLVVW